MHKNIFSKRLQLNFNRMNICSQSPTFHCLVDHYNACFLILYIYIFSIFDVIRLHNRYDNMENKHYTDR